jgi:hypothetical protein
LNYATRGSYVPLVEYVTEVEVPIISFSVGSYWDSYYRNRPWLDNARNGATAGKRTGATLDVTGATTAGA